MPGVSVSNGTNQSICSSLYYYICESSSSGCTRSTLHIGQFLLVSHKRLSVHDSEYKLHNTNTTDNSDVTFYQYASALALGDARFIILRLVSSKENLPQERNGPKVFFVLESLVPPESLQNK